MKQQLDEMQEQKLLKIEHNGFWIGWAALLIAGMGQLLFCGGFWMALGELLVFMGLCLYMVIACLKEGIWDRKIAPTRKNNFRISLLAGSLVGLFWLGFAALRGFGHRPWLLAGLFLGGWVLTSALCYGTMALCMVILKNRRRKLDEE